jgi:hypothetical protein
MQTTFPSQFNSYNVNPNLINPNTSKFDLRSLTPTSLCNTISKPSINDPYKGVPINDIKYMDPLYRPYFNKSNYKTNTGYPLVDQRLYNKGDISTSGANAKSKGLAFRSQQYGICPEGWVMSANQMCIPIPLPSHGFYKDMRVVALGYSNNKIPYNDYTDKKFDRFC